MFADIGHNDGAITNPGVSADCDAWPDAGLLADRNVESIDAVLTAAIHDRYVRAKQNIVFQRYITEAAVRSYVHLVPYLGRGVGERGAKCEESIGPTARQNELV